MVGFLKFLKRKRLNSSFRYRDDSLKNRSDTASTCLDDSTEHDDAPWRASKFEKIKDILSAFSFGAVVGKSCFHQLLLLFTLILI